MKTLNRKQYAIYWFIVLWMSMTFSSFSQNKSTSNINSFEWVYIPQNISITTEIGKDYAIVNYKTPTVNNPNGISIKQINGFATGAKIPIGEFLYEFKATDTLGNEIKCSFSVIVNDEENPIIVDCPNDIVTNPDSGNCQKVVVYNNPSFTDNSTSIDSEILPGDILFTGVRCDSPDSITFVTLKTLLPGTELHITDKGWLNEGEFRSGEGVTTWQTVEQVEAGKEIIISGLNTNIGICTGNSLSLSASGDQLFLYAGELPTHSNSSKFICGIQLNSSAGSTINSWDSDATSTTTSGKPAAIIPGFNGLKFSPERDNMVYSGSKNGSLQQLRSLISDPSNWNTSNTGELIISGNTLTIYEPRLIKEYGQESGTNFTSGTTEIKYSVTDFSENKTDCSFNIVVIDTTKPVFENTEDIFVTTNSTNCYATVSYNLPKASDICGILRYEIIESPVNGNEFPLGESKIQVKASDQSGNFAVKDFNIIVEDKSPPEFFSVNDILTMSESGKGPVVIHYDIPVAYDNCSTVTVTKIEGLGSGEEFPPGITIEKYQAIDGNGNSSTVTFKVIVKENNRPEILIDETIEIKEDDSTSVEFQISDADTLDQLQVKYELLNQNIHIKDWQEDNNTIKFKIHTEKNYNGSSKLKLNVCDNTNAPNESDSCEVFINILPIDDPPEMLLNDSLFVKEGESIKIGLNLFEIIDVDTPYDDLALHLNSLPLHGEIFFNEQKLEIKDSIKLEYLKNNEIIYIHNSSESIFDFLNISISDATTKSCGVIIPISIKPVNDKPVLTKINRFIINEDSLLKLDFNFFGDFIKDNDNDFEELDVFFIGNQKLTVTEDNDEKKYLFRPKLNWSGLTNCKLIVNDGTSEVYQYIEFYIKQVNDPPEFLYYPEQLIFDNESFVELNLYSMIADVETENSDIDIEFNTGDSININFDKSNGELILNSKENFSGEDELKIKITDEEGAQAEIKINVLVNNITGIDDGRKLPKQFKLHNPFPNPFNPSTSIEFEIPKRESVEISVYDLLGKKIKTFIDCEKEIGKYKIVFEAEELSSGIYFVKMQTKEYFEVKKLMFIK